MKQLLIFTVAILIALGVSLVMPFPGWRALIIGLLGGGAAVSISLGLCKLLGLFGEYQD